MKTTWEQGRRFFFITVWIITTVFLGWQLLQRQPSSDSRIGLVNFILLLLCTVTLLIQIPNPIKDQPLEKPKNKGLLFFLIVVLATLLFLIPTRLIRILLFILPITAVLVLILLRQSLGKREFFYALGLALLAGFTGGGEGRIPWASPTLWSMLQLFLVLTSLLAGWSIVQFSGLRQEGIGKSLFLSNGVIAAFKAFASGLLFAMPWAFWNIVVARDYPDAWALRDSWLKAWWQPIFALQPGISEEAWARVFLVPLFFLVFRTVSRPRTAFVVALYVMAYWFAYLHTPGGSTAIQNTIMLGTLYSLPLSYLCLYRDLETAMGFHFWVDFIRFAFAFMLFNK